MWIYLAIFFLFVILYVANKQSISRQQFFILFMSIGIFVGVSDMLGGYDRYIYGELFDSMAIDVHYNGINYMDTQIFRFYSTELGFGFFNYIISFITINRYIFIFITTIVAYFLIYKSIIKYCSNYQLAAILFMGLIFFFSFTYLRQVLGVSIGWLSIQYIYKRKFWKFLLFVSVAFTMHNSAILLFPLYFIPIKKYAPKYIIIIAVFALLIGVSGLIGNMYEGYTEAMNDRRAGYTNMGSGFRIEYLLEAIVFLVLLIPFQKYVPNTKKDITLLNVGICFCFILMIFIKSLNGGRLAWFFAIGIISTLSLLCQKLRRLPNYSLTTILICFFLYFRILMVWSILLYPYKSFFTNGHRANDLIFPLYEYDYNYDTDKFYK